jgi:putative NADH-flavin reductase
MKLTIFGATGSSGRALVSEALHRGHAVRAFVRDPARLPLRHARLEVARGDVYDREAVDAAVAGREAIIGALGIRRGSPKTLVADGTRHILDAMERHGVRRYVGLSAYGAGDSRDGSLFVRFTWLLLRPNLEDKERHEELVRASGLDWTLVRPPRLTDAPASGRFRTGTDLEMRLTSKVSRADVAAFMLDQLTDPTFVRRTPAIVGTR